MGQHEKAPELDQEANQWVLGAELHEEVMREELARTKSQDDTQSTLDHAAAGVELRKQQTGHLEK